MSLLLKLQVMGVTPTGTSLKYYVMWKKNTFLIAQMIHLVVFTKTRQLKSMPSQGWAENAEMLPEYLVFSAASLCSLIRCS